MIERSRLERPEWPVERVLELIDDGCVLFDRRLDCVYANEPGSALFGLAPDQLLGRNLHSQFPAAITSEFQRAALPAFANRTPARATLHDEPTGRWLEAAMHPSSEGLLAIIADITSAKRAELELAAHTEYLQQLVDQIPAFLWVIDRDLIVRRIEGGRPMLKALDRDRLIGLSQKVVTEMGCNAEDTELSLEMHRRVLRGMPGQYRATWKGITLESRIRPLRDRDDSIVGIVGVGIDVTEQARMEEQLRESVTKELELESQLRQSQKLEALGQLAGGVAHDFNNVLAAINGFAQLLLEDLPADDARRHDVDEIVKAAERATRITRQLLAFSRHQVPAATRIDVVEVVHELSRMLRAVLPATIELRVSPESGGPLIEVLADRSQLEQVVMNLAVNARDAMPAGGTLSVDVRTGTTPESAHTAVLEVRDTGTGMTPEVQAHVFEPFFTTKEPGRGTGLGLATVYGIVRQHSGSIEIASVVGEGTTVTVRLPMAAPGVEPVVDEVRGMERDHGGRVLVVEDEAQVREVAARFLRRAGYEVLTASDAGTALELLASARSLDLVLTDSAMPGMRGEDLAIEISRVQPGLPVILMSGYADPAQPSTSGAVAAFVQKPFTMPALLAEVRRVIGRGRVS
jgi:two-component system cell cycle sensor histidine kinase/response regulator CckA